MKKALSLLLAVLMLVSLFSGMAFADDDVIVEEPVAADEFVGDDYAEAADAVEEFTDEGSFEAADIQTLAEFLDALPADWTVEHTEPNVEDAVCGETIEVWVADATGFVAAPRAVLFDHVWADPADPNWPDSANPAVMDNDPEVVRDGVNGWKLISSSQGSCTEGGVLTYQRVCMINPAHIETKTVTVQAGTHTWATDPFTYAFYNGFDTDWVYNNQYVVIPGHVDHPDNIARAYDLDADDSTPEDYRAIKQMPTATKAGKGHEVCLICGAENPNTEDYVIPAHRGNTENSFHLYSPWRDKVPATCLLPGWEEKVCNILGCQGSHNRPIQPWNHVDPETGRDLMVFDHLERVTCVQYVEVWKCTNPLCCTKAVFDETLGRWVLDSTYPKASQYLEYRGVEDAGGAVGYEIGVNAWISLEDAIDAAEAGIYDDYKTAAEDRTVAYDAAVEAYKAGGTLEALVNALAQADEDFEAAIPDAQAIADDVFFWYTDTTQGRTTEPYEHHKYESDYELVIAPACCVPGLNMRTCSACGDSSIFESEALSPIFGTTVYTVNKSWDDQGQETQLEHYYHYVACTRPECANGNLKPNLSKIVGIPQTDPRFYTQANNANPQTKIVDHDWSDWVVELAPKGSNRGHWYRTCMIRGCDGRQDFFGTQAEFDAMNEHPVLQSGLIPELEDGKAVYKLYLMGEFAEDYTGMWEQDGGLFYVEDGYLRQDANGATLVDDVWYYLAGGEVQFVNTLAEYDTEWFLVEDGVIDIEKSALVEYNGGLFVVAEGRKVKEYSGLWQNAKSIGGEDEWYYVANGEVQKDFTGITEYDGHWFYLENGKLIPDYTGTVEYDGEEFDFVNGQLVA